MSMTERRESRERLGRLANRNHSPCHTNHTMALNPYPLTPAPPYGRRRDHAGTAVRRYWFATRAIARPALVALTQPSPPAEPAAATSSRTPRHPEGRRRGGQYLLGFALMQLRPELIADGRTRLAALAGRG